MPNAYDYGNIIRVRFGFPSRALTDAEKATFSSGGGLPVGVGVDPTTVKFDYTPPGAAKSTDTYPTNIVKDAVGEYHRDLDTTIATTGGDWIYRGYSTGSGQAAIKSRFFVESP
jgi:hypothetical protein